MELKKGNQGATQFHVEPRYTQATPGPRDEDQALKVAGEERIAYHSARDGHAGLGWLKKACDKGLRGIVERRIEHPDGWHISDMITGETCIRPFNSMPNAEAHPSGKPEPKPKPKRCDLLDMLEEVDEELRRWIEAPDRFLNKEAAEDAEALQTKVELLLEACGL